MKKLTFSNSTLEHHVQRCVRHTEFTLEPSLCPIIGRNDHVPRQPARLLYLHLGWGAAACARGQLAWKFSCRTPRDAARASSGLVGRRRAVGACRAWETLNRRVAALLGSGEVPRGRCAGGGSRGLRISSVFRGIRIGLNRAEKVGQDLVLAASNSA